MKDHISRDVHPSVHPLLSEGTSLITVSAVLIPAVRCNRRHSFLSLRVSDVCCEHSPVLLLWCWVYFARTLLHFALLPIWVTPDRPSASLDPVSLQVQTAAGLAKSLLGSPAFRGQIPRPAAYSFPRRIVLGIEKDTGSYALSLESLSRSGFQDVVSEVIFKTGYPLCHSHGCSRVHTCVGIPGNWCIKLVGLTRT